MGYGQYERNIRRRRNNTSLTVTIIALVVCLVLALTGFALSLTGAKRAAQELNDRNAQQEARISELEKQLEQSDVNALKEEIERLKKELEKANADKEALQAQINELNRRLEAKQQQNGELAKKKLIALTFDDGPGSRTTPELLDFLKEHNVKATFFVIGINAKKHKDILARMAAEGHVVGNHSDQHKNLKNLGSVEEIKKAVSECNEIIKEATGTARIRCRMGAKISLKTRNRADNTAHTEPIISPETYPAVILNIVSRTARQNSAVFPSSANVKKTARG